MSLWHHRCLLTACHHQRIRHRVRVVALVVIQRRLDRESMQFLFFFFFRECSDIFFIFFFSLSSSNFFFFPKHKITGISMKMVLFMKHVKIIKQKIYIKILNVMPLVSVVIVHQRKDATPWVNHQV